MLETLRADLADLARAADLPGTGVRRLMAAAATDSFVVDLLFRAREALDRRRVPLLPHLLRLAGTVVYGVEVDRAVRLGHGVYFVHTVGTVVGGDARVGDRVRLMGGNVLGTARDDGYPQVGDDVTLGIGAKVLGPVRVGDRAVIGAGAVVLEDVPADALAVGVPARIVLRRSTHPAPSAA